MVDPTDALVILGGSYASRDVIRKLLGPTADYLGDGIKDLVAHRISNLQAIFASAATKTGKKLDDDGQVPPRVLKGILDEGSYCDDELVVEYFGGVLASSRTGMARDDRGVTFITLLGNLSTYQIRSHYILYRVMKDLLSGPEVLIADVEDREKLSIYMPVEIYFRSMDFDDPESAQFSQIWVNTMWGLSNAGLIENMFYGRREFLRNYYQAAPGPGIICSPTILGLELFLWAHGKSDVSTRDVFNNEMQFDPDPGVTIQPGSVKIPAPKGALGL